jgi:hypothetical protein
MFIAMEAKLLPRGLEVPGVVHCRERGVQFWALIGRPLKSWACVREVVAVRPSNLIGFAWIASRDDSRGHSLNFFQLHNDATLPLRLQRT